MDAKEKSTQEDVSYNETKDRLNEKKFRNFENTFLHDWKQVLKRVDEGRKCCEMLRRIFEEIIRVETEYESNLRNICELFREFDNESGGIKNGINSLKTNIERRCEQIKEFVSSIEGEILNSTLSATLINHKNVFDQIKVDGIENEKIVERTKQESIKSIESCVSAYESLINAIHIFQNNIFLHPLKKIELSNICINKYLLAKKKEDEYKNTIYIIKEIELKKEKRVKSILYSLESMDYKRISCIKDNIMKYLIFFTSYIRNVQYDLNNSINIFKDICADEEINEYCLLHNKTEKQNFERIIFFTNIVSWPMLIDYLGEINSVHKKKVNGSKYDALEGGEYNREENSPSKQGNIFSNIFNVDIYKNLIQTNNKKTPNVVQNNFYSNIFNEIVFFNKKDNAADEENIKGIKNKLESEKKEYENSETGNITETEIRTGIDIDIRKEDSISETRSESYCESPGLSRMEDTDISYSDIPASDVTLNVSSDPLTDEKKNVKESCDDISDFERSKKTEKEDGTMKITVNSDVEKEREKAEEDVKEEEEEQRNFKRLADNNACLEKEKFINDATDISTNETEKEIQIYEMCNSSLSVNQKEIINDKNNGNFNYREQYASSESAKKGKNNKVRLNNSDITSTYNLSHNIKDDLKKMEIYFLFYLNNLYGGKFERIAHINITKYFNTYNNRFIFCQCLMNFIKKEKTKFPFLKSIVLFANVILKFLDYCGAYVDYWSAIYILVASENFYFELEKNMSVNISVLLSKYTLFDKSKNSVPIKNIEVFNKKKISEESNVKGVVKSVARSEKSASSDVTDNPTKGGTIFQKMRDKFTKVTTDTVIGDPNRNVNTITGQNSPRPQQIKSVVNIYENEKNDIIDTSGIGTNGSDNLEQMKINDLKDKEKKKENISDVKEITGNTEERKPCDENEGEQYRKLFLHKFLYAHNLWNNIKFWEVCFLVIISEIIQEIILLEKCRYENKEEMIKNYFFFSKYFNFYNSMIKFGLSMNQIGLLLNKIFHHFDLKNDSTARKYFFQIIDITTNKNISLNYIKMKTPENTNTSYKNYYLQYYNNFFNDEKPFKKNA